MNRSWGKKGKFTLAPAPSLQTENGTMADIVPFRAGHPERLFLIPPPPCPDSSSLAQYLL